MSESLLPLVTDPAELEGKIDADEIVIVDLSRAPVYARNHIPGQHILIIQKSSLTVLL